MDAGHVPHCPAPSDTSPAPRRAGGRQPCQCNPVITPQPGVVRARAGRLHSQCEAGKAVIVNLKGLCAGLSHHTRKELRSNEGLHVHFSCNWELQGEPSSACAYKRKECRILDIRAWHRAGALPWALHAGKYSPIEAGGKAFKEYSEAATDEAQLKAAQPNAL